MSRSAIEYLRHILDETEYLMNRSQGLTYEEFLNDPTLQRAFVRSLEIIGEAAKQIPPEMREKYGHIELVPAAIPDPQTYGPADETTRWAYSGKRSCC
ncbi:MAG: DUF86 domain-containing protein [Chloroflexi bacterium]|nr:MAG: DUF86 domain-containing protein [Chloroflexota bacterium]